MKVYAQGVLCYSVFLTLRPQLTKASQGKSLCHMVMSEPPAKKLKEDGEEERENPSSIEPKTEVCEGEDSSFTAVQEKDVGISEYLGNTAGFFAIIKRRYSDFVVHELAKDRGVVKLSGYSLPIEVAESSVDEVGLEAVLGAETVLAIKQLVENEDKSGELKLKISLDKEQRGVVHKAVRVLYPSLTSETIEVEGEEGGERSVPRRSIVLSHASSSKKRDSRGDWPRERGSYCKFVLYKENKDTMDAVAVLSRLLKVKPSCFSYAGTKDKRAITSQQLTAFKISANRLHELNHKLRNMKLGNFKYVPSPLKLGDLAGNHFTVVLRNVSCEDHVISEGVESLARDGFVNYFGMQRFGTSSVPTHHIGRCLMHSDWQGAIDLVLKPRPGENEEVSVAREFYESSGGDVTGTLARMPKSRYVERCLLLGLQKHKDLGNYLGAFNFIPKNTRMMYIHSWQSWCWNHLVSWRLKRLGPHPVVGDLISGDNCKGKSISYVTEENSCDFELTDVLLPLPGYAVQLPHNEVKEEYERLLAEEGMGQEQFQQRVKSLTLAGSYRPIVVKPTRVQWETFQYDDVTVPLVLTDLDLLAAKQPPTNLSSGGSLKAVKLDFSLCSSSYATMAVRELTRMNTSSAYQSTLGQ